MKNLLYLSVVLLLTTTCFSQKNRGTYDWGVGVKYRPAAVSIKKYTSQGDAMEMLLSKYDEGYRATLLLELSPNVDPKKTIRYVLGPGLHVGYREKKYVARNDHNPVLGVDFILGVEWKLPKIPFSIQVDYQPSFDIVGYNNAYKDWGGATIRYTW
jgi:hypothetical protein